MWDGHLVRINFAKHRVKLHQPDTAPVPSAPYRAGLEIQELGKTKINKMLAENNTKSAQTTWAAPIVSILKMDKTLLYCVDYRKLNTVTKQYSFPIPRMNECIDLLGKATVF